MTAMKRIYYAGEGTFTHPRIAGLSFTRLGHAVDVEAGLADELVESGVFAWETPAEPIRRSFAEVVEPTERSDAFAEVVPAEPSGLSDVPGIGEGRAQQLREFGVATVDDLKNLSDDRCHEIALELYGVSDERVMGWRNDAKEL